VALVLSGLARSLDSSIAGHRAAGGANCRASRQANRPTNSRAGHATDNCTCRTTSDFSGRVLTFGSRGAVLSTEAGAATPVAPAPPHVVSVLVEWTIAAATCPLVAEAHFLGIVGRGGIQRPRAAVRLVPEAMGRFDVLPATTGAVLGFVARSEARRSLL